MKNFLIVTYVDFWRGGAGHRSRLSEVIKFLKGKTRVTVVFIGIEYEQDSIQLKQNFSEITFYYLERIQELSNELYVERFADFIRQKYFDIALFEYIELHALLFLMPASTTTLLDTNDILSDKIESFKKSGIAYSGLSVNFEEEIKIYLKFSYTILINKNDFEKVSQHIGSHKLMLVPHPVSAMKSFVRDRMKVITFIASEYEPNIRAINWFLETVWPLVSRADICLHVYGKVANYVTPELLDQRVNLMGFTDNLEEAYRISDIIINPVKAGAGLKIKNIEALGHGIPLITTSHGASGLEDGFPGAFIIADSATEFSSELNRLINNSWLRTSLSEKAIAFSQITFSVEKCFQPILEILEK